MKTPRIPTARFAVCLDNRDYEASLDVAKLYRIVPDDDAARRGYLRVIDESGEDYAYAAPRFFVLGAPASLRRALDEHTKQRVVLRRR
jgi:hypothetical protein